ncbi:hypothetical protein J6X13_02890 [Candidatus Saccharibacteria bacterium]|nr:hypothetical protein [Candidatus Saccharibacteria bacterium]
MKLYKRIRLTKEELAHLRRECEGYVWAAVDPRKCVISIGDDYLYDLRDVLVMRRCRLEDIYGVGIDLTSGEINYVAQINRRNPTVKEHGEPSDEQKDEIVHALHYFFDRLPIIQ